MSIFVGLTLFILVSPSMATGRRLYGFPNQDSVPHIALLGSGGGERAVVAMLGSIQQLVKESLFDTMLYIGGISGSTW